MVTKILYVITKANWGGAQRYVYDLATAAKERGDEVAVAYGSPGELADRLRSEGIPTFAITGLGRDARLFKDATAFFSLIRIIRSYNPNVIHLNSSKIGGLGTLAARLSGVKNIIFTAHGWAFNEERPRYQKAVIAFIAWLTILLSTRTILVSAAMQKQVARWPFIHRKMRVVQNGTRLYSLLERHEARRTLAALHPALAETDLEHDLWVGTVAELHQVKGLPYAIEAIATLCKKYPTIRYVIVGEGQMRPALETQIAKNNLQHHVFLLGSVREAPLYGHAYDVFLLPSLSEAIGLALLEAGLAALPTVATRVGGMPEIIIDEETGLLIPPRDPGAIAQALTTLFTDTSLQQRLGTALRQHVKTEFSLERVVRETFALY